MSSTILATAGRIVHRLIERHGLEADAMFLSADLDPEKLNDPKARYPLDRSLELWRLISEQIEDPCWGLAAGDLWRPTDFHALGYAYLASGTLESALKRMERYFRIVTQGWSLRSSITDDGFSMTHVVSPAAANFPASQDTRLSIGLRMCREVYGQEFRFREVRLAHPWQACGYEDFFGCPVRFVCDPIGSCLVERPLPHKGPRPGVDRWSEEPARALVAAGNGRLIPPELGCGGGCRRRPCAVGQSPSHRPR